jgi:hypothetical protein
MRHQIASFQLLYHRISSRGIYLVEEKADEIWRFTSRWALEPTRFTISTASSHFTIVL